MQPIPLGLVEQVSPFRVSGWALDRANPALALDLVLRVDGIAVDWFRPNARIPAIADHLRWPQDRVGLIGFNVRLPEWVADGQQHSIEVMVAATGTQLKCTGSTVCHTSAHHLLARMQPHLPNGAIKQGLAPSPAVADAAPQVSVLVLNRNGSALLRHLFESWQRHNHTVAVEWIVVDHASTDDSLALLENWRARLALQVMALDFNDSFSASCNRAAAAASGEFLLFLNNDIVWLHDALPAMLDTLHDQSVGAVGMKLLKSLGSDTYARPGNTTVQHLGVRYLQSNDGYWPYEATPSQNNQENEFALQETAAVTAAAMLCRRADYERLGGFDTRYFYGYEDVEFCLRLRHRLGKRIVCRNDLTALHRHGYTRLTGRETGQIERIQNNARVLGAATGLWAKRDWWNSLLSADGVMCAEPLTIGMVVDQPLHTEANQTGTAPKPTRLLQWAQWLGHAIAQVHPQARVLLVHPGIDAFDVRALHVLVVATASYDITQLRHARADLMVLAWVRGSLAAWRARPWWASFHGYVAPTAARAEELMAVAGVHVVVHSSAQPLGNYLVPDQWPLRVGVDWLGDADTAELAAPQDAIKLQARLKQAGMACWLLPTQPDPAGRRVIDVRVYISPAQSAAGAPATPPAQLEGVVNVMWHCAHRSKGAKVQRNQIHPAAAAAAAWHTTVTAPTAMQLRALWKKQIDHTFSAP
jgi:GT2 family glycosyltransferase